MTRMLTRIIAIAALSTLVAGSRRLRGRKSNIA